MKITEEKFKKLLTIAKLDLNKEQDRLKQDLESIGLWVQKINKFDTSVVDSTFYISKEKNNLRSDDDQYKPLKQIEVLKNAPEHDSNYFRIFPYIEK